MQDNNTFESIVQAWRERSDWTATNNRLSMSGDSHDNQGFKGKAEEVEKAEKVQPPSSVGAAVVAGAGAGAVPGAVTSTPLSNAARSDETTTTDENTNLIFNKYEDTDPGKEGAGDAKIKDDNDYLEENEDSEHSKTSAAIKQKHEQNDKMDGVYVKRPPPHKTRSNSSIIDDEGCGMKCLYFTMQCCECSLM